MTEEERLTHKRPKVAIIQAGNWQAQYLAAKEAQYRSHLRLLELGYEWDGMDGYTAPPGTTPEQMKEHLK